MQLLYFITTVTNQVHSARHHQRERYSALPRASSFYPRAQASRVMQSGWCPCMSSKKIVIERTRDLIYLKFVAKDFFPKIISSSAGENASDSV